MRRSLLMVTLLRPVHINQALSIGPSYQTRTWATHVSPPFRRPHDMNGWWRPCCGKRERRTTHDPDRISEAVRKGDGVSHSLARTHARRRPAPPAFDVVTGRTATVHPHDQRLILHENDATRPKHQSFILAHKLAFDTACLPFHQHTRQRDGDNQT